jgi:CRP/FNR family transcriptional regulator, cyclic AMP receptor protein
MVTALQAPIIMMSQNRQSHKDRLRADLDYRVNLKNELALNEILRRIHVLEQDNPKPRVVKQSSREFVSSG